MLRHDSSLICIKSENSNYSARIWYNLCRTGSLTNLDDLNIARPIKSDKMGHMTVIKQLKMGRRDDIQSLSNLVFLQLCYWPLQESVLNG